MRTSKFQRAGLAVAAAAALSLTGLATAGSAAAAPETAHHMATQAGRSTTATGGNLAYAGGNVVTSPTVYIVYWGSQWGSGSITNDPAGEAALQLSFFQHAYGSGDTWSTSQTQYCQGVATGSTNCNGAGTAVGHPAANPVGGTWLDSGVTAPRKPGSSQIAAEAQRAAAHFGVSGDNVQIIVDAPTGVVPQGFKTSYCAWHDHTSVNGADLPYTNMPYVADAGSGCGAGFVATGSSGVNSNSEGVTIVGGHEYAETLTDPAPSSGWTDSAGSETGDKCAWISSGQGASSIISMNGANFAVQSLWSNNFNGNAGGCVTSYTSATNQH